MKEVVELYPSVIFLEWAHEYVMDRDREYALFLLNEEMVKGV